MTASELRRLVAYTYQALGRRRLLEEDFVRLLSHERRWIAPSKARALVQAARIQGLLRSAGAHAYEQAHEVQNVRVPVDYRPDAASLDAALQEAPPPHGTVPLFRRLVRAISEATHESEEAVVAAINQVQAEAGGLLRAEVAALFVARLREVDVGAFFDEAERRLQKSPAPGAT